MKKIIKVLKISLLSIFFLLPNFSLAAISFTDGKWETTFDYQECTQRGNPLGSGNINCANVQNDGIVWSWGASCLLNNCTQVSSSANNPVGIGNGSRFWYADFAKESSGAIRVDFPEPQKEFWMRWYMRYENGASWKNNYVHFNKLFYIRTPGTAETATQMIPSLADDFVLGAQSTGNDQNIPKFPNAGWMDIYPTGFADGRWVCYEIQIKMDTQGVKVCTDPENLNSCYHSEPFNGIGRLWVDGQMMGEYTNLNLSEMHSDARQGWSWFDFHNNQNETNVNQLLAYVDYDDIVIYNQTPPNLDTNGNPFIGPIDWVNGEDDIQPSSPTGLNVL